LNFVVEFREKICRRDAAKSLAMIKAAGALAFGTTEPAKGVSPG
jgi:hypothetical protein